MFSMIAKLVMLKRLSIATIIIELQASLPKKIAQSPIAFFYDVSYNSLRGKNHVSRNEAERSAKKRSRKA